MPIARNAPCNWRWRAGRRCGLVHLHAHAVQVGRPAGAPCTCTRAPCTWTRPRRALGRPAVHLHDRPCTCTHRAVHLAPHLDSAPCAPSASTWSRSSCSPSSVVATMTRGRRSPACWSSPGRSSPAGRSRGSRRGSTGDPGRRGGARGRSASPSRSRCCCASPRSRDRAGVHRRRVRVPRAGARRAAVARVGRVGGRRRGATRYGMSRSLPPARRSTMRACASLTSSSGSSVVATGCRAPAASSSSTCAAFADSSAGVRASPP